MKTPGVDISVPSDQKQMIEAIFMAMIHLTNVMRRMAHATDIAGPDYIPELRKLFVAAETEMATCVEGSMGMGLMQALAAPMNQTPPKPDLRLVQPTTS